MRGIKVSVVLGDPVLMAITRLATLILCATMLFVLVDGFAQSSAAIQQQLVVQQAVLQQQENQMQKAIDDLTAALERERQAQLLMKEEVAIQKGVGIGVAAVIGLLQTLQMILQVRQGRSNGKL